ncbi:MAG: hypothetical protein CGW95_07315 [Phenylobacterium zucineum]|nr:MAG: hypothetical protein CGW95_07315 [Phenylobacterium zucineum]
MTGLSDRKIEIVRLLMATSPDSVVGGLQSALAGSYDPALAEVRNLVSAEMSDRRFRDVVFGPLIRMFDDPSKVKDRLVFPKSALPLIWRALKEDAPDQVAMVKSLLEGATVESRTGPLNSLLRRIEHGLQDEASDVYVAAAATLNAAKPGLVKVLCACLALAPVVRDASFRLADWVERSNDERAAAMRITYRDATSLSDDNGPLLFEMLAANLEEPWMIIRLISLVMDRPTQRYLAESELSTFPTRVMDLIDVNLAEINRFSHTNTQDQARATAAVVKLVARQISELEAGIEFARESGWGARVQKQRQALAHAVESRMRKAEALVTAALPYHSVRGAHVSRKIPRMTMPPKAEDIDNARTLLTFMDAIRPSASAGGFASARNKVAESVAEGLDRYAEDGLSLIRDHEVENLDLAATHLTYAAEFLEYARDSVSADLVRRRIIAAVENERRDVAKYG